MSLLLSTPDLLVLVLSLSLPMVLTVVLCMLRRDNPSTSQFLMGDRQLPVLPVTVSLSVSFISVNFVLNMSQETSLSCILFLSIMLISCALAMAMVPDLFMSVYYKMHLTSVYEYMELRFSSTLVRRLASLTFLLASQLFLGVVMLAACETISIITGIPVWPYLTCGGLIYLLVVACGGLTPIVWSDTWLAGVFISGLVSVIVCASQDDPLWLVNSFERESLAWVDGGTSSPGIHDRTIHTLAVCSGQVIMWFSIYGCHQTTVQRYCSTKSAGHAKWSCRLSCLVTLVLSCGAIFAHMSIDNKWQQFGQESTDGKFEDKVTYFTSKVLFFCKL